MCRKGTCIACRGQVWMLPDMLGDKQHPYLILSNCSGRTFGNIRYQAFTISSMNGYDIYGAVPIVLCNDKVSYVMPFNISNYCEADFMTKGTYRGSLKPDEKYQSEFIQMCLDIYSCANGFASDDAYRKIRNAYTSYIQKFWKVNGEMPENRRTASEVKWWEHPEPEFRFGDIAKNTVVPKRYTADHKNDSNSVQKIVLVPEENKIVTELADTKIPSVKDWENSELIKFMTLYQSKVPSSTDMMKMFGFKTPSGLYNLKFRVQKELDKRQLRFVEVN